ncbi:MAG: dihydropteroate synthase, partial [Planctomycetaceae bacterium]
AEHAFYLGYELARAEVALLLGKQYVQDAPITFGVAGKWGASSAIHNHGDDPGSPPARPATT